MDYPETPYAGLLLPDAEDLDIGAILRIAATVLDSHQSRALRGATIRPEKLTVFGAQCGLRLRLDTENDLGPRLILRIITRPGTEPDEDLAARVLSDTVLAALEVCDADVIEWYAPDVLIDRADFIRLRSYVSSRRIHGVAEAEEMARCDEMRDVLYGGQAVEDTAPEETAALPLHPAAHFRARIEACSPGEIRLGAASWAMTGILATFTLPVAATLSVLSLLRGTDFRLTTQVLSVTMLFVSLGNTGSVQQVLHGLIH